MLTHRMFTKLFSSLTTSSIWNEANETRILWITMLAMANKAGYVAASVGGLAHAARMDRASCERGLQVLMSPDEDSRSKEYEGRRVEIVEGGFQLLNYPKYRAMRSEEERKEYMKTYMAEYRKRNKPVNNVSECKPALAQAEERRGEADKKREEKDVAIAPSKASSDEEFIGEIKALYPKVNVDSEISKMKAWFLTPRGRGRKLTRGFMVNWLNKIDVPMDAVQKPQTISLTDKMKAQQ